jgi:hypothetical protein
LNLAFFVFVVNIAFNRLTVSAILGTFSGKLGGTATNLLGEHPFWLVTLPNLVSDTPHYQSDALQKVTPRLSILLVLELTPPLAKILKIQYNNSGYTNAE